MEVLSDILRSMRVQGSVYFCDYLHAPWSKDFKDTTSASFHLVRRGECWVMSGERMECLGPGDLVFIEPGPELVVNKLTEVVLVELIRINFGRGEQSRFIKALSDKRIAKALQHLHNNPHISWTLEKMGKAIGMSRAAFAKRFKELVGQPMFDLDSEFHGSVMW